MRFTWLVLLLFVASPFVVAEDKATPNSKASAKKKATAESASYYKMQSTIVGDKEQPAVSYFVPWQGTSTPDKLQWNLDEKYDQSLDLIDRDVVVRSMNVYDELGLESPQSVSE